MAAVAATLKLADVEVRTAGLLNDSYRSIYRDNGASDELLGRYQTNGHVGWVGEQARQLQQTVAESEPELAAAIEPFIGLGSGPPVPDLSPERMAQAISCGGLYAAAVEYHAMGAEALAYVIDGFAMIGTQLDMLAGDIPDLDTIDDYSGTVAEAAESVAFYAMVYALQHNVAAKPWAEALDTGRSEAVSELWHAGQQMKSFYDWIAAADATWGAFRGAGWKGLLQGFQDGSGLSGKTFDLVVSWVCNNAVEQARTSP
jgi:hypothetical protein